MGLPKADACKNTQKKKGTLLRGRNLIIYILPQEGYNTVRAGFSIGKRTGKAFQRNKIRRILKEILRKVLIPFAIDIFIIARKHIAQAGYVELKEELEKILNKFFLTK